MNTRIGRNLPSLEEGDVEDGRVVVDELEEEHLEGEAVLVLRLRLTPLYTPHKHNVMTSAECARH